MSQLMSTKDRISSLDDPILCHILSFLPTKFAATTTVLSKRWNLLWLSVPTLYFDDEAFKDGLSFYKFMSSVFLLRDIMLPLQSFHLKCSDLINFNQHDISQFVQAAVQRVGMEKLNLIFKVDKGIWYNIVKLPPRIFSCKTLVVLHLTRVKVNDLSNVIVDLPRLKTLHLDRARFERFEYLPKLLSRCPILEELHINGLCPDARARLYLEENIECLPNLMIANISNFSINVDVLFTLCCRATVLWIQPDMKYLNASYRQFSMCHNLTYMKLILKNNNSKKWNWLLEVLKYCPKLQNLTIHEGPMVGYEVVDNWIDPPIAPECVSTQLKTCLLNGFKCTECGIQFAKYIIQNSKVLNTMSIKSASSLDQDLNAKYQMIKKLALPRRASTTCELVLN